MKVVIANLSKPFECADNFKEYWSSYEKYPPPQRLTLMEQPHDWGFHIFAIAAHMLDLGLADEAEFWDYRNDRYTSFHPTGVRRLSFFNQADIDCYMRRFGYPDLIINYGRIGLPVIESLDGKSFRVSVPCLRAENSLTGNVHAECYLVDAEEYLDSRSMLYIPVVHTGKIFPIDCAKERDFIYLASAYPGKRHDLLLSALRGSGLSGHLHPVSQNALDLRDTKITTSDWYERDIVELLRPSRIAVYPGDNTSNPAAMWECVAAGLPILVNEEILGGKHLVIPGVTGELASPKHLRQGIEQLLANRKSYRPAEYFEAHWNTTAVLNNYLEFFQTMGLKI